MHNTRASIIGAVAHVVASVVVAGVFVSTAPTAFAQAQVQADAAASGLNALSDDRVLSELARRNLRGVLEYSFEKMGTSQEKRDAVLASSALLRLQDKTISINDRRKLVAEYVKALDQLLPQMNDATTLMRDAGILIENGIDTDQRLLEYFGTNSSIMSRLHPVADAVQKMLAKARDSANAAAEKATNNWPAGKAAWERADQQATLAEYTRNIINYSSAISLDKASPDREKRIEEGLENLSPFDDEGNPNRAFVKVFVAKLNMAKSTKESLDLARKDFAAVIQGGDPANIGQQFDARLLSVVTEINAKAVPAANAALSALEAWIKEKIPDKDGARDDANTAVAAMRYRILMLESDLANGADKAKKAQAADQVLNDLLKEQPGLQGLILELMAANIKPDTPIKDLNSLLLQSVRAKAEAETIKPAGVAFDKAAIERGLQAAQEIIKRNDKANPKVIEDSLFVSGFFLQKLDRNEAAANAFLDFVDRAKGTDLDRATMALNNAIAMVGPLWQAQQGEPSITKLYERTLKTAVEKPFERPEFFFQYARRLQINKKHDEAIAIFDKITDSNKDAPEARYFKMVAINSKLDQLKRNDKQRPALLADLQKLADQVSATFDKQLAATTDDKIRNIYRTRLSQTRLLAAKIAQFDQNDPKRAITLLTDFEKNVKGLPGEQALMGEVMLIRVQAYMKTNQAAEGVGQIVKLAQERPAEAMPMVLDLQDKLNEQVVQAETAGRDDVVADLERARAQLTPVLVKLIRESNNAELKKYAYTAAVFDADTQRRAAELTTEAATRTQLLQAALKRFEELDSKEQFQQFIEAQDPAKRARLKYDPQVKLGLARTYFALGEWDKARMPLARMFADKILGEGFRFVNNPAGGVDQVDNPTYWEAFYRLLKCNIELKENVEGMKGWLASQYSNYGDSLGGERWGKELKQLAADLGIQPPAPVAPAPTAPAAPAAAAN